MKQQNPPLSAGSGVAVSKRRVYIKSYGCQMNVYDSTRMADVLEGEGYAQTDDPAEADAIILNTCHIREKAAEKVYSELGKLKALKRERADRGLSTQIAVAGCVAQAEGAEIIRRQPAVDLVFGPQSYHRLPQLLGSAADAPGIVDTDFPIEDKFELLPVPSPARLSARGVSAFVTVQEGCDKFCAFCVVPYTRGAEVSRPVAGVLAEVLDLASAGVSEITLIGQNVNAYHGQDADGRPVTLAGLIAQVAAVGGVSRVRYMTSHPNDMGDDLIACHGGVPRLMPFLHLPVQSGSDRILAAMNRKHTADDYLRLVERIRSARPDIAFSSDFIVGFPGETDADFQATVDLVEAVGFASAYSFKYSPRAGTPAATLADPVSEEKMKERLAVLQTLLDEQRRAFNESMIGRRLDVLFEKTGRHPGQITGKSPYLQPVHVTGSIELIGKTASVEITKLMSNSLAGRLAEELDGPSVRTSS